MLTLMFMLMLELASLGWQGAISAINDISNITITKPDWCTIKKGPDKTNNNILMELTKEKRYIL